MIQHFPMSSTSLEALPKLGSLHQIFMLLKLL